MYHDQVEHKVQQSAYVCIYNFPFATRDVINVSLSPLLPLSHSIGFFFVAKLTAPV